MKKMKYDIRIRIPALLHKQMLDDLHRPHSFAAERVGFLFTSSVSLGENIMLIIATDYLPVADEDYEVDPSVGAKINSLAIRKAMQEIFNRKGGCFHVHLHDHSGIPQPSLTDQKGLPGVAKSFSNIAGKQANGILIMSRDCFYASVKMRQEEHFVPPFSISVVGFPMHIQYPELRKFRPLAHFERQSFLGKKAGLLFENIRVSIVGYGGGGSHIGQQLSHLGVKHINVFDADVIEDTNLNRLIGAWFTDIRRKVLKTTIAKRVIKKIQPRAEVNAINSRWQDSPELLESSDVVIGCVDSYSEREQLEAECRRYLISYIDIGMDVFQKEDQSFSMSGQVILSQPGAPCMHCFGYLTTEKLAMEAKRYGDAGGRPQVVWPNGVLASTATGLFVNLVTGWTKQTSPLFYMAYDGNQATLSQHIRLRFAPETCIHFPIGETGVPKYKKL